ncbi:MFS transporter [Modestobacter lapidis]
MGPRLLLPLCAGTVLNPVNSTMIATALSPIGREFAVGAGATTWLVSVMYLASAIGQPVAGRLADEFGPRRVFLGGCLLVAVGGLIGALGPTFSWLVAARAVLGLGAGAAFPAGMAMVREQADRLGESAPTRILGLLNTASLVTLTVGPPLGGVLVDTVGWRALFAVNVPLGLATTALGLLYLPRSRPRVRAVAAWRLLDLPGTLLFSGVVTLLLIVLTALPRPPWLLFPALILCMFGFVLVELRATRPFLDVRMLAANPPLVVTYLRVLLTFLVVYGVLFGLTPWLQEGRGLSASVAGLILLGMFAAGTVASLFGMRGRTTVVAAAGSRPGRARRRPGTGRRRRDHAGRRLGLRGGVFGLPNGMGQVANQIMVYRAAPAEQLGTATGLTRTAQYVGAMVATSVVGLSYADGVADPGLHILAWAFSGVGVLLVAITLVDRGLRRPTGA